MSSCAVSRNLTLAALVGLLVGTSTAVGALGWAAAAVVFVGLSAVNVAARRRGRPSACGPQCSVPSRRSRTGRREVDASSS